MIANLKPYPEYKESGLSWLRQVPAHWHEFRLDRLFNLRCEIPLPDDGRVTGYLNGRVTLRSNVKGQKIKGVIKDGGWIRVHPGDFAISGMNAHLGGMGVSDSFGKCSPIYLILVPKLGTNPQFVSHLLRHVAHVGALKSYVNTIRYNSADFKRDALKLFFIAMPSVNEQVAIVRFLDYATRRMEKAIRAKRKTITLLNEEKQAIINQAVTRGLDPQVRLKPSGIEWLGEVPEHWDVISVGSSTTLLQTGPFGSQLHSNEYVTSGTPVINPSHMKDGRIIPDPAISVSDMKMKELERHCVKVGDIIVARRGELGRCALVTPFEEGWLCGTGSLLIRCKKSIFDPAYFQLLFASQSIGDSLSLASVGATMSNLNTGMVARLRMPLPPIVEQRQIVKYIETEKQHYEITTSTVYREIVLIREYRTRLIADVVTGKLDVRDVQLPEEIALAEIDDSIDNEEQVFDDDAILESEDICEEDV